MTTGFLCRECGQHTVSACKDSREVEIDGERVIKRRRECSICGARISTYERVLLAGVEAVRRHNAEERLQAENRRLQRAIETMKNALREAELSIQEARE